MDAEQNTEQNATTPTAEPVKADESKTSVEENSETPVTNGDASKEELNVKVPEVESAEVETEKAKTQEEPAANTETSHIPKDEPKADEPVPQAKVEESEKPAADEPKLIADETPVVQPAVEEVKEVRSEEIPPPLPSSNPPSQVTVFAESTKANVLSVDEISVCEKPELPVDVSVSPSEHSSHHPQVSESPKIESVAIEPTLESHVESIQSNVESPIDIACPVPLKTDNLPESEVSSLVEDVPATAIVTANPNVERSEISEANSNGNNKSIVEPVLIIESSPLKASIIPKESGETVNEISSEISGGILEGGDSSLDRNESETTNLTESKDSNDIESGQISLKVEDEDNAVSIPSLPMLIDEKMPVVSSEGDMLNPLDSQSSLQSDGSELQELISNINLKDSPTSQENSLISEQQSDILSTIPEADSKELRLEEDNSSVKTTEALASGDLATTDLSTESSQKDMEPVCNADSLPDLSTESLPSLPEPTDSIIEPMSLPPLDFVPDPLVDDNIPTSPSTKLDSSPIPQETAPVVLTNGNATNGLKASPTADDDETPTLPPLDGPLKQVVAPEPIVEEKSQTAGDAPVESVESTPAAAE
ncbi:hypothetical protein WA026_014858 [Henosepilachna vigintioctopunctata]|uniref:Uncharacterized protein n=1 Tax=Henosepilachna vigintioctopunctata TaxID=420089 RepID=A0AAW1UTB9_9CUCU